ncbi:metal-sulfur cluster assembly factor [Leuconostoc mesenteroides]|uniref:metal-sulfur cluster assembly factor n=1 Tax=Leuconostoc mesenteroides TaxID=1245 RepID=UPI001F24575E|nr:iron-sulfur cluster assembly protein [Leuconostoc mesenteroides]
MENKTQELQDQLLEALSQLIDPELRCDIVSLGLVYRLAIDENGHVTVKLTLNTMGCRLH